MVRIVFGALFLCGSLTNLTKGDLPGAAFGLVIGAVLIWYGWKAIEAKREEQRLIQEAEANVITAFTFRLTGVTHECRFARAGTHRQQIISHHKVGDLCFLRIYEWEGEPAVAVVDRKTGEDLGVVPAKDVKKVVELMERYDTVARILTSEDFTYYGKNYTTFVIQIDCMISTTI